MKVYVHEKGVILAGKSWEILQKLKEYQKEYETVSNWINDIAKK